MDFYGIEIRLCRFYRAQTKGKVESGVKYVKRNALVGRQFRDLEDLNAWLLSWAVRIADKRIHGTTHEQTAERFERAERGALMPVVARPPAMSAAFTTAEGLVTTLTRAHQDNRLEEKLKQLESLRAFDSFADLTGGNPDLGPRDLPLRRVVFHADHRRAKSLRGLARPEPGRRCHRFLRARQPYRRQP
jgi:hypothetical protein